MVDLLTVLFSENIVSFVLLGAKKLWNEPYMTFGTMN